MKNFFFSVAALLLMAVIFISGGSILHSGDIMAKVTSARISANKNSDKITKSDLEKYSRDTSALTLEPTELTADIIKTVVVNGEKYALPIRVGDLSDNFVLSVYHHGELNEETQKYNGLARLSYNGKPIASASYENNIPELTDDAVITALQFNSSVNEYFPQVTAAGIDIGNADLREINRLYGYDSDEYGYDRFTAEDGGSVYFMSFLPGEKEDRSGVNLRFLEDKTELKKFRDICFFTDSITLPENYTIENDIANSLMEYAPIPENNDKFHEVMDLITNDAGLPQLPCTLNALMSSLGDDVYFDIDSSDNWEDEFGKFTCSGAIKSDEDKTKYIAVEILFPPDTPIGDAQVTEINLVLGYKAEEALDLEGKNPYGFVFDDDNSSDDAHLTELKYNNIFISGYRATICYWSENTEEQ